MTVFRKQFERPLGYRESTLSKQAGWSRRRRETAEGTMAPFLDHRAKCNFAWKAASLGSFCMMILVK